MQPQHQKEGMMRNILYFVGAGLTKSLELPGKPVPLMNDYISVMANYPDDDVIRITLAYLELKGLYSKNKPAKSIEYLLQKADSTAALRFIYAISRLFCCVDWDIKWDPIQKFIKKQF